MSLERAYAACSDCYKINQSQGDKIQKALVSNNSRYEAMRALESVIEDPAKGIDFGSANLGKREKIVAKMRNPAKEALEACRTCQYGTTKIADILDKKVFKKKD